MKKFRSQQGFTLVEIAIVLVIVGLVLFGVLKGQEMVKSGKVKKTLKQADQLKAAIIAYSDKTGGKLPGSATNTLGVFQDLDKAGLISFDATAGMLNAYGEKMTATYNGSNANVIITSLKVPESTARLLDIAQDDGKGNAGDIQIGAPYVADPDSPAPKTVTIIFKN